MKYDKENKEIKLDKVFNKLDEFTFDFANITKKHTDYVIISGYISILFGRSRATEDIDMFIKKLSKKQFSIFYNDLINGGFWCLNSDDKNEIFNYLNEGLAVRFAKGNSPIPNMEVKFPKDFLDEETFNDSLKVKLPKGELKISSFERHIAFKKYFLGSQKDEEDAAHIEELFGEYLNKEKIRRVEELIKKRKNEIEEQYDTN